MYFATDPVALDKTGLKVIDAMSQLEVPDGIELWTIQTVNPDGVAMDTRGNARGVDLNRNFATANWASVSAGTDRYSGPSAASEPETQAAQAFLDELRPTLVVIWHQVGNHVDDNHSVARYDLLEAFAMYVGMSRVVTPCGGALCVATATQYINGKGGATAFTVELPSSVSTALANRQAGGFLRTAALLAG